MPIPSRKPPAHEGDLANRRLLALKAAHDLGREVLEGSSADLLTSAIVRDHAATDVQPRYQDLFINTYEPTRIAGADVPPTAEPLQMQFVLPVEGAASFGLSYVGGSSQHNGDHSEYLLDFKLGDSATQDETVLQGAIRDLKDGWLAHVRERVEQANLALRKAREEMDRDVRAIVQERWSRQRAIANVTRELNIPLGRQESPVPSIPLKPVQLTLPVVEAAAAAGGSEQGLAADIADSLVTTIEAFSHALERTPVTANKIAEQDEEAIRDVLLFILNANWQGQATGETFLGIGKADIVLRWRDRDAFVGECKFWKGEKLFVSGVDQLLERYTVWRATRVALILFVRDITDISSVLTKAHEAIEAHTRYVGPAKAVGGTRSYAMAAQHDRAQIVTLTLLPVVMPKT